MIIIAHIAYIIRVVSYYFLNTAWWVLPIEVSHGLTYALIWPAGVAYASRSVAPEFETTAQGLFSGVFGGIGSAGGALMGGIVYELYGARILFAGTGGMMALNLLIFLITYQNPVKAFKKKIEKDQEREKRRLSQFVLPDTNKLNLNAPLLVNESTQTLI